MSEQLALLPGHLTGHLQLTMVALLLGTLFSVPMGVLARRVPWLERVVLGVASVVQTIPSLALLAVMVPLLAALHLTSIGYLPALVGLFLYSMLPILRNTVTGIAGVDPAVIEAAKSVGMTGRQQLLRVELPLAMPMIVAGIRTSTVWVVGTATLSTPIGARSLGNYIFSGLQTRNFTAVLVGCVAAAALALVLDGLIRALEHGIRRGARALVGLSLGILLLLYLFTFATLASRLLETEERRPIVVGSKTFTEQYILSEVIARQIRQVTGHPTRLVQSLGSTVAFDALRAGEIDVYVDYSGTIWATIMHRNAIADRQQVLRQTEAFLRKRHGVRLVGDLGFENAYALAMRGEHARRLGLKRISDLTPHAPRLCIGGDYEFFSRPEWSALQRTYGLEFKRRRSMDSSLMYQAAAQGNVDVFSAFSTDGRITALDLVVLEDDQGAIPPYDAVILTSPRLERESPDVVKALGQLVRTIDQERMRQMNLAVDRDKQSPATVAKKFLRGRQGQ